jgi:hypothetical protein
LARTVATAEQIRAEITRRIAARAAIEGKCADCAAPTPVPIELRGDGVNWSIEHFPSLPDGCVPFMMSVLNSVMRDYELADGPASAKRRRSQDIRSPMPPDKVPPHDD